VVTSQPPFPAAPQRILSTFNMVTYVPFPSCVLSLLCEFVLLLWFLGSVSFLECEQRLHLALVRRRCRLVREPDAELHLRDGRPLGGSDLRLRGPALGCAGHSPTLAQFQCDSMYALRFTLMFDEFFCLFFSISFSFQFLLLLYAFSLIC
jgi:hypothetical protein